MEWAWDGVGIQLVSGDPECVPSGRRSILHSQEAEICRAFFEETCVELC